MSPALSGSAGADRQKQQRTHKSREAERARDSAWTGQGGSHVALGAGSGCSEDTWEFP